mmetsp:Transcript_6102/g.23512  ORF Transcript_6102/g.23512 Transcript_6102/m.23512 type:complete len:496 (+) Transcript_6102:2550-4037(+)
MASSSSPSPSPLPRVGVGAAAAAAATRTGAAAEAPLGWIHPRSGRRGTSGSMARAPPSSPARRRTEDRRRSPEFTGASPAGSSAPSSCRDVARRLDADLVTRHGETSASRLPGTAAVAVGFLAGAFLRLACPASGAAATAAGIRVKGVGLGGCPRFFAAVLACSWWSITSADLSASRSKVGLTGRMSWTTLEMRARHPSSLRSSVPRSVSLSPIPENPPKLFCRKPPLPRLFCRSFFSFDNMSLICIFLPTINTIGGMLGIDGASLNILHHSVHSGARKHSSMTRTAQPSLRLCARKIAVATSADHSFRWCSVCGNLAPASMYTCVAAPAHVAAWPMAFASECFAMTDNTRVSGSSCRSRAASTLFRTSRGTLSTIVVPLSSSDEQVIVPPIEWTMLLVIARPKPVPPYSRVEETEAWPKGMNMSLSLSRAMPMPLSQTSNATTTLGACGARKSFSITSFSAPWFVPSSTSSWCWSRASPIVHDLPRPTPLAMSS